MKHLVTFALVSSLAAFACGGSSNAPAQSPSTTAAPEKSEHEHHDEHQNIDPTLKDFHGVLAPVWHSDPGAGRAEKTCSAMPSFKEKAAATKDAELISDVAAVETACAAPGKPDVETKLKAVHERFHALAEAKH